MNSADPGEQAPPLVLALNLRYSHALGALGPFFAGLERGIAMAIRCAACGRSWCPPRFVCHCGEEAREWVQLSGCGTVIAATRGHTSLPLTTIQGELAFALVALDGAANRMFARLEAPLRSGTRVRLARGEGDFAHPVQRALFVASS